MIVIPPILISIFIFIKSLLLPTAYIEGVVGPIDSIYPPRATTDAEKTIVSLVYRSLYKYNDQGILVPDLAKNTEIADDGLSYTVTLIDGAKWHSGEDIVANDVLYSASLYPSLSEIGTDKINDLAVKFTLPNKFSPFLSILTFPLVKAEESTKLDNLFVTGSGDYRVIKATKTGRGVSEIVLSTTNPVYILNKISFKVYGSETDLQMAYKLGEIDGFFSKKEFNYPGMHKIPIPIYGRYFVLHFNNAKEPFSNKDLRKKIAKSLDLQYLQDTLLKGSVVKTEGVISNNWATKKDSVFLEYDPNQTPEETPIKWELLYSNSRELETVAQYIKSQAEKLNILISLKSASPAEINQTISTNRTYDAVLLGEEVGRDPDRYVFWHSTQQQYPGFNLSQLSNIRADKALEKGREETDPEKRIEHYDILQNVINEETPAIFLYHDIYYYNMSDKIVTPLIENLYYPWERMNNIERWNYKTEI